MNRENSGKYNTDSSGHTYGYDYRGGWDIDTSDRTQRESDGGHIPGRYQWEETVDVSKGDNYGIDEFKLSDDDKKYNK